MTKTKQTKNQIVDHLFSAYYVSKKLYQEQPYSEYWRGCESEAWHIIFMTDLADEYFKWEAENHQYYD